MGNGKSCVSFQPSLDFRDKGFKKSLSKYQLAFFKKSNTVIQTDSSRKPTVSFRRSALPPSHPVAWVCVF